MVDNMLISARIGLIFIILYVYGEVNGKYIG